MPHKRGQFSENKIRAASPSLYHLMMMKLKLLDIFPPPSYKSYLELTMMTQHCIAISPLQPILCTSAKVCNYLLYFYSEA